MAERPWLSGGKGTFETFKKQSHDEARAVMREQAAKGDEWPTGKYRDIGGGNRQMDQGGYTSPGDIKKFQKGKLPAKESRESHVSDIARANQNLEQIRKKNLPIDEHHAETAKWHNLKQGAEQKLAKMPASEQRGTQEGARGGRFYIAATGAKVYVKNNPGAETVGHMSNQRFHQGLPMSVHLAEPKKSR